ncbi:hypothetical protein BX600DRAFT_508580 [Xylariales sp. PMI_506]|nr:hypothetical protein BX600DRAFT_508580 [Xylariales sp. PMI_506]
MSRSHYEELLRQVEEHHTRYLRSLREFVEAAGEERNVGPHTPPLKPVAPAPTFASEFSPVLVTGRRPRRLTNETGERRPSGLKNIPASLQGVDIESSDDEDFQPLAISPTPTGLSNIDHLYVQQPLAQEYFDDHSLFLHLRHALFGEATQRALEKVFKRREELDITTMFQVLDSEDEELQNSATYEVYEVGKDGQAIQKHADDDNDAECILEAQTVWDTIKYTNSGGQAVGRIVSLFEPSPLMLGAIHLNMSQQFDMDEIFQQLVTTEGNKGKTKAYMHRAFESTELRRRSFFFVFKYYTVVKDGFAPAAWQAHDERPEDKRSQDHIDISEGSSIIGLSLSGDHIRTVERKRKRAKTQAGCIYDAFGPWQLLNIQCFPDDEHEVRHKDSRKDYCNGPHAFLDSLAVEYRDAVKRNLALHDLITKLIHPPADFIFNYRLRDKLLFEDQHYTYSRRYFWAYNTLGVINEGIKSMITAYSETFPKDFWTGRHQTLFPHPDAAHGSPEFLAYLNKLRPLRQELDATVTQLWRVYEKNEATRQEIKSLRDQLFSGSSVKESRRAIEQGDNIKLLTSLSMIFLPLTFVTSVWSMTGFPLDVDDWQFPVTMICACVPFLLFVCMLQTRYGMEAFVGSFEWLDRRFRAISASMSWKRDGRALPSLPPPLPTPTPLRQPTRAQVAPGKSPDGEPLSRAESRPKKRKRFSRRGTIPHGTDASGPTAGSKGTRKVEWRWWRNASSKTSEGVV